MKPGMRRSSCCKILQYSLARCVSAHPAIKFSSLVTASVGEIGKVQFLTPRFFDVLVLAIVVIGLVLAARQIRHDFKRGPRWPANSPAATPEKLTDLPAGSADEERRP